MSMLSKETLYLKAILHVLEEMNIVYIIRQIVQYTLSMLLNHTGGYCEEIVKIGDKFPSFMLPEFRVSLENRLCHLLTMKNYSVSQSSLLTEMNQTDSRFYHSQLSHQTFLDKFFSSCTYKKCVLRDCKFIEGLWRWGYIQNSVFIDCDIYMDFEGAFFDNVKFLNCTFCCSVNKSTFKGVKFNSCTFKKLEILSTFCVECQFLDCSCPEDSTDTDIGTFSSGGLSFYDGTVFNSRFEKCYIPNNGFRGENINIDESEFVDSSFPLASILGTFTSCKICSCVLKRALFEYCVFSECTFEGSDFMGSSFRGALISKTLFKETTMSYTDFRSYEYPCETLIESSIFEMCPVFDKTFEQKGTISSTPGCLKGVVFKGPGLSRDDFDI